jgi:hypothetical protein
LKRRPQFRPIVLPKIFRFSHEVESNLQLIPHQELDLLSRGVATESALHVLAARLNTGMVCIRRFWPDQQDGIQAMDDALNGLVCTWNRFLTTKKLGVSGDALKAMGIGLNYTDDMQKILTRRQFGDALQYVLNQATK